MILKYTTAIILLFEYKNLFDKIYWIFSQIELDLVFTLSASNITVLQPSRIRQEDNPMDIPYLFVRLMTPI